MLLGDSGDTSVLPDGTTVTFTMVQVSGSKRLSSAGVIDDLTTRAVHYQWAGDDTDTPGVYRAQWKLTYPGGAPESFPSDEPLYVIIHPSL